ncbi:mitochondrial import inner membrane translocase subunit tim23 [Aulographum hederae CBS 113979]|uniref:Mitochondrial import inner membrane translocase subunit tim23 n=1 Tax=Aulographum hederae CBS 113979 TaxID=1176131 RepID=A0A6G1H363_9PEZI|nr:mitochondrial import inner membrane translocase subunit tim23 [Aulographum hederae CBS 113979]
MTIWDTLSGRKSSSPSTSASSNNPDSRDAFIPDSPTGSGSSPTYASSSSPSSSPSAAFNTTLLDPAQLHPLANLNQDTLDYLTLDESVLSDLPGSQSALPSRGWSDDLCYGTGVTYLTALAVGGAWGLAEGLNRSAAATSPALRVNSCLNAITRRGPFLGNSAGVIAMVYNGVNSTIGYYRGKHDSANSIAAGAISGAIFKSTRGLRPMMISSAMVAGAAGSWAVARKALL